LTAEEATAWHRRFAAAGNNRAWDLSVQSRNPAEDHEMLNAAHASAWHWTTVGSELHRMRATMLLAEVHALLGSGRRPVLTKRPPISKVSAPAAVAGSISGTLATELPTVS
jgi:hypothetical protein